MKKILSVFLSVMMFFTLSIPAFAADYSDSSVTSVTINEYDVYVHTRTASPDELAEAGVPSEQVKLIKSNMIEDELTRLSKLTTEELTDLGYSIQQIAILHDYNGERIENAPELRGIFSDMTASFSKVSASTTSLTVQVQWTWSSHPALCGVAITDMIAMRWQGTNTAGQPINVAFNSSGSSCNVKYYSTVGETYKFSQNASIVCDSPYDHAYAYIPMALEKPGDMDNYAKTGTMKIRVNRTGTDSIKEAAFVFGYGHTTVVISPSLSLPASFGIGFSTGTEKMVEKAIRMNNAGTITKY